MTATPQLNTAKINQLADAVTDLPFYNFWMNTWLWAPRPMPSITPNPDDPAQTALDYSTAGCVAGWVGIDVMCSYADINPKDDTDTLRRLADTGRVGWLAEPKE